jgi:acyl-CoA thioesterase-1
MLNLKIISIGIGALVLSFLVWWIQSDANKQLIEEVPKRAGEITIIAFGDSLTAGYGLSASEAYPAQLEAALVSVGKSVRVINEGVSGETTSENLERAVSVRAQNPDIVLLGIGGNDALRQLPVEDTRRNITQTIDILRGGENPPVVVLLRMQAPITSGLSYKQTFDALYTEIAESKRVILSPFLSTEVYLEGPNRLPDGIHLTAQGYGIIVEEYLLPILIPLLTQMEG